MPSTFWMSQFCSDGWPLIAAVAFIAWDTSLATTNDGFNVYAWVLNLFQ